MINLNMDGLRQGFWKHFPLAALIGVVIALEMSYVLMGGFREPPKGLTASQAAAGLSTNNTMELGKLLYTQYIYPLEIAAVILLVAIISAIALTLRRRKDSRAVDPSVQVVVKARDRMEVVKVEATKAPVAPVAVDAEAEKK
jgi:NADH-quinone oxidoreductase subunit J